MKRQKNLPSSAIPYLSDARVANATLSLNPGQLGIPGRKRTGEHPIADLVSAMGDLVSREYISQDKKGTDILKSDQFSIKNNKYLEVSKDKYPHHHIKDVDEINKRIDSIIKARKT